MKQIKFFLALVIVWMAGASVTWADISVSMNDGITLQLAITDADAKTCELVDILMPSEGGFDLPATVSYGGETYAVTSIAGRSTIVSRQFSETLTSLVLPEGLLTIGQSAFFDCEKLTTLTIPASVTSIGDGAFSGCTALTDVTLKIRDYNTYAFSSYTNLSGRSYHNVFPASTEATFHVTEMFYQGIQQGLMAEGWTEFTGLYSANNDKFDVMAPEVGDMTIVTMNVVNDAGTTVSTRNVVVTFTDVTPGQGKAIVYRPMRDELYNPATCWTKDAYGADEASYFGNVDPDYTAAEGTLVIPTSIYLNNNDYALTGIGGSGFYCNYDPAITGIRIPKTITQIGVRGLAGLQYLKGTLVIPSSVTQIGDPSVDEPHVFCEGQYYDWSNPSSSYYVERLYFMHREDNIVWYDTDASKYFSEGRSGFTSGKPYLYYYGSVITKKPDASHSGFGTWRSGYTYYFDPTTSGIFFSEDQWFDPMTRFEAYEAGEVSVTKLTNLFNLPVTFTTTDEDVAKVKVDSEGQPILDDEDNLIFIIGEEVGEATITATFAGDTYFDAGEAVLTVVHKGPAELGSQVNTNNKNTAQTLSGLTKITFGYDDLALKEQYGDISIEDEDDLQIWPAATLHDNKIYASAYAEADYGCLVDGPSEGYYSYYGNGAGYRLCYNPSELTPNWGAGAWDGETFDPRPGTNCAGLLAFKVPTGEGTIIVKGYTDNENAKMAIRLGLADAETMIMAGYDGGEWNPMPKEFAYQYNNDSNADAWIYIFGVSLKPDDEHRGHIESITYLPDGVTIAKLSIAGTQVAEGSPYNDNGISVTWAEGFGGIEGGDPEMGDEGGSSLMPVITLSNANLTSNNGPAIEVNSYSMVTINLVGNNTVSSTKADCAAISFGTMNGNDWEGCGNVIIKPETDGTDVSLTVPAQSHATGVYNYSSSITLSSVIADFGGTDYGLYIIPGNMSGGEGPMNPPLELNSSFLKLRGDESAYVFEGGGWQGFDIDEQIIEAMSGPVSDGTAYWYNNETGRLESDEDVATYLWIGPVCEYLESVPAKWSTYSQEDWTGLDFSKVVVWDDEGEASVSNDALLCYVVSNINLENLTLTLTRVTRFFYEDKNERGMLLYNATGEAADVLVPHYEGERSTVTNHLAGTCNSGYDIDVPATEGEYSNLVLTKKNGQYVFRPLANTRRLNSKAYLPIPTSALQSDGNGVKGFSIVLEDDDPTGIANIENLRVPASVVFDLLGRQQQIMQRQGIYIRDGKKIIVK